MVKNAKVGRCPDCGCDVLGMPDEKAPRCRLCHDKRANLYHDKRANADAINPSHYKSHTSGVECIVVVEHMNFCVGNVIKYCWRAGLKEGVEEIEDLRKAAWYLAREISRRERLAK